MNLAKKLRSSVRKKKRQFQLSRKLKSDLRKNSVFLLDGSWKIEPRFAYHEREETGTLVSTLRNMVTPKDSQELNLFWNIANFVDLKKIRVNSVENELNADVVYRARDGNLKFFDSQSKLVFSKSTEENWKNKEQLYSLAIFRYFNNPPFHFQRIDEQGFLVEQLLAAPDLKTFKSSQRSFVLSQLIKQYHSYVVHDSKLEKDVTSPRNVFEEVAGKAVASGFYEIESYREDYLKFISRTKFIEGHLDFNLANILYDHSFHLLDNDDAGLLVPAFYDIFNIAFNEFYYWNDRKWLIFFESDEILLELVAFCEECVTEFNLGELHLVYIAHFVYLNSNKVRGNLGLPEKSSVEVGLGFQNLMRILP